MLKVIGAIIILGATTWIGFEIAKHLSHRPKQIQQFRHSLEILEAEIMYGHTPLGTAAKKIALQVSEPIASHFQFFADELKNDEATVKGSWEKSLQRIWTLTVLKQNEYEILLQFGENLGRHDRATEQKQIMLTLSHLEREEERARDIQERYGKMVKSLGVLSGMLIIILLV